MRRKKRKPLNPYAKSIYAITPSRLLEGMVSYGLFCEKLPPVFSSSSFYNHCMKNQISTDNVWKKFIYYESMRNINSPRAMAIPNPFSYYRLCKCMADHFPEIQDYFKTKTEGQKHRVSRIHIRLMKNENKLFQMNYNSGTLQRSEELNLQIGKTYRVKADIASCFPSMYSHALAWALAGKQEAKTNIGNNKKYYNKIDEFSRNMVFGETKGFLIGPHISNLLSEIILVAVDYELKGYWDAYIRHIDDYTFYAKDEEEAYAFIRDLNRALRLYDLQLNSKKTIIEKLPIGCDDWVHAIKHYQYSTLSAKSPIGVERISVFTDYVIDLLKQNSNNLSIVSFALKVIAQYALDNQARQYYINLICNLAIQYPYIVPYLDKYLFVPFDVDISIISLITSKIYDFSYKHGYYECGAYALFFAIKYRFKIDTYDFKRAEESNDCIFLIMSWLYAKHFDIKRDMTEYKKLAMSLTQTESEKDNSLYSFWLFWYEVLGTNDLTDYWKTIKQKGISFLLPMSAYVSRLTPNLHSIPFNIESCSNAEEVLDLCKNIENEVFPDAPADKQELRLKLLNNILSNIYLGYITKNNIEISRSFNSFWKGKLSEEDFSLLKCIVDILRDNHFLGEKRGKYPDHLTPGYVSRYWAKDKLLSQFAKLKTSMINTGKDERVVILRYKNKKDVPHFKDTDKSRLYKKTLTDINRLYAARSFSYTPIITGQTEPLYPRLKSIFNNRSWDYGGRLYSSAFRGVSYQNISEQERKTILIDNNKTVELDYSSLHITMLYARENMPVPAAPYDILSRDLRPLVKRATLVLINAETEVSALGSLKNSKHDLTQQFDLSDKDQKLLSSFQKCECSLEEVIGTIKEHFSPIAKYFGSGIGLKLQNIDSLMALEIVQHFAEMGVPCLPVHDSFVVPYNYENELRDIMSVTFRKYNNNYNCEIKKK